MDLIVWQLCLDIKPSDIHEVLYRRCKVTISRLKMKLKKHKKRKKVAARASPPQKKSLTLPQ